MLSRVHVCTIFDLYSLLAMKLMALVCMCVYIFNINIFIRFAKNCISRDISLNLYICVYKSLFYSSEISINFDEVGKKTT